MPLRGIEERDVDRMVMDLAEPWALLPQHRGRSAAGRGSYRLRAHGAAGQAVRRPRASRRLRRRSGDGNASAVVGRRKGLSVRPEHRMIGHTGLIVTGPSVACRASGRRRRRDHRTHVDWAHAAVVAELKSIDGLRAMTKDAIRHKVWNRVTVAGVARFPTAYGRIPNFKQAEWAARLVCQLAICKRARVVKFDPAPPS